MRNIVTIQSRYLKTEVPFAVAAPQRRHKGERFPAVYMLHGMARWEKFIPEPMERAFFERIVSGKGEPVWINGREVRTFQELADALRVILVAVNGGQGWYVDSPVLQNSRYESHLIREVIPYVDKHFPTIKSAPGRALVGHSMGGFGAVRMLAKYPKLFQMAGARSAALWVCKPSRHLLGKLITPVFGNPLKNAAFRRAEEPARLIEKLKGTDKRLLLSVGVHDHKALLESNRALHRKLLALKVAHDYEETYDGHEFSPYMRNLTIACARALSACNTKFV